MGSIEIVATKLSEFPLELVSCPLCRSTAAEDYLTRPDGMKVVRCQRCEFLFLNPRPQRDALLGVYQDSSYYEDGAGVSSYRGYIASQQKQVDEGWHVGHAILDLVEQQLPLKGKHVVDVGCGAGALLGIASSRGAIVCGLEISEDIARAARIKYGVLVTVGTLENNDLIDGSFDLLLLSEVIEHLPDPIRALREAHRILKPGGFVFITTPNTGCVQRYGKDWLGFHKSFEHLAYFDVTSLARAAELASFEVRGSWTFGYGAPVLLPPSRVGRLGVVRRAAKVVLRRLPAVRDWLRTLRYRQGLKPSEGPDQAHDLWLLAQKVEPVTASVLSCSVSRAVTSPPNNVGAQRTAAGHRSRRKVLMLAWSDLRFYPPVFSLAYSLALHRAEVRVLGFKEHKGPTGSCRPNLNFQIYRVNSTAVRPLHKISCFVRMLFRLTWMSLSWRPTAVVAHGSQALALAAYAASLSRASLVYGAHEVADKPPESPWLRLAFRLERLLASRCAAVACASPERAEILHRRLHLRKKPLVQENSPFGVGGFCDCSVESAVEFARRRASQVEYVVVYAGRIGPGVGVEQLCSAILALPENYALVAAGLVNAIFRAKFEELFQQPRLFYYGTVPYQHLRRWLRGASVGVALYEPTDINTVHAAPCKMYEYLAAGVPVLCNSFPLASQIIARNNLGECVKEISPEAIASSIRRSCENCNRKSMSENCRRFFESNLAYEHTATPLVTACLNQS
jgi:SAM-dependent methyltransferase